MADKKQNIMFCAQIMDAHPTIPSYLRAPRSSKSVKGSNSSGGNGSGPFASTYDSRGGSSTAASSMYTNSPNNERDVGSSSAPPPVPSPPKSRWGFGFNTTRGGGGPMEGAGAPAALPAAEAGEGKVYYDSDGEVESAPACGLGLFSIFGCISRN